MASIIIIFGSTSGNTELVCHAVSEVLTAKGHQVTIQRAEHSEPKDITPHDLAILAASTYGHGILQDHMIPFMKKFRQHNWKGQDFAVIGLGDDKYDADYNIESAHIIEKDIYESSGHAIHQSLRINKSPIGQMNKVKDWTKELNKKIKTNS